jgi:hypothetical protein
MDDWDAEDFEVPTLNVAASPVKPPAAPANDDEEEDLALKEVEPVKATPSAAVLAAQEKKAKEEEKILAAKAAIAATENETAHEKKLREAKQLEESETALANEMLGGTSNKSRQEGGGDLTKGLGSIVLKTKEDHVKYGTITRQKLSTSSAFNIAAFYKSLSKVLDQPSVSAESLDEIINELTAIRDTKAKAAKKVEKKAPSKKEQQKSMAAIHDKFGGMDVVSKYDHLSNMEDDFM